MTVIERQPLDLDLTKAVGGSAADCERSNGVTPHTMTHSDDRREEHLKAEEDDGSAELQPEDGGTAPTPSDDEESADQR